MKTLFLRPCRLPPGPRRVYPPPPPFLPREPDLPLGLRPSALEELPASAGGPGNYKGFSIPHKQNDNYYFKQYSDGVDCSSSALLLRRRDVARRRLEEFKMKFRTGYYYTPYSSLGEAMGGSGGGGGGGGGGRAGKRKQVGRATLVFLICSVLFCGIKIY